MTYEVRTYPDDIGREFNSRAAAIAYARKLANKGAGPVLIYRWDAEGELLLGTVG